MFFGGVKEAVCGASFVGGGLFAVGLGIDVADAAGDVSSKESDAEAFGEGVGFVGVAHGKEDQKFVASVVFSVEEIGRAADAALQRTGCRREGAVSFVVALGVEGAKIVEIDHENGDVRRCPTEQRSVLFKQPPGTQPGL